MSETNELTNENLGEEITNDTPEETQEEQENINDNEKETEENNSEEIKNNNDNSENYGAPEEYKYDDIKIPKDFEIDKDLLKEFNALNKEFNLSQKSASKYMEFGLKLAKKQAGEIPNILKQAQQAKITQLQYELNRDEEIGGGNKAKMDAYLDVADKGYSAFANDKVKEALSEAGLNYHPEIIKMFHRIGELVGDDKIYPTKTPSGTSTDTADILYGSNNN